MSLVEHTGHATIVECAECGTVLNRREAFMVHGEAFCCVLHEVEYFVRTS